MSHVFEYEVKPTESGFEARTPYREIVYLGSTEQEAIGAMLKGVAELAWRGSLDPAAPERKGSPPLQHTMDIICDHLRWHLNQRRERIESSHTEISPFGSGPSSDLPRELRCLSELARTNEIISGLATSIAALARIKAL